MTIEIKVDALPESVADATVGTWHKHVGDAVRRDETIVDLETDKVVLEIPMPQDGVIKEIRASEGDTVVPGNVLAVVEAGSVKADSAPAAASASTSSPAPEAATPATTDDSDKFSPAVRRMVEENAVDPTNIQGTGKDGRLTKGDVLGALKQESPEAPAVPDAVSLAPAGSRTDRRVPMTRMRKRIAERMNEAQSSAAMLTSFNEVDLTAVKALRAKYKEAFIAEHGTKLGFMSFFVAAAVKALKKFPVVNASLEDGDIVYHDYYDVGIAVSTERGLVVPVLRNSENMTLADIERNIKGFATRARDGKITLEELTGGTFSITNGGVFGSMMSTPILNMPQSAILGMHAIMDRPMAVNGQVEIRPMMYLALTYDHRIIDGSDAVQFLVEIKNALEDPARLLLHV